MKVLAALRWFVSIGFKVFRVVPWATNLGVVCTLVSQIASLLASLLPLKVIILLGSERIPSYFPPLLQDHGKTALIVGLGGAALFFFVIHLLAEWSIARLAAYGARSLIAHSRKLALFENQEQLLSKAYQRFAGALAGAVFIALAALALAWVYPLQAMVVGSYIATVWVALAVIQRFCNVWRGQQVGELIRLVGVLANLGFFVTFGAIVFDVLQGTQVSVFWAIVTLLLVRQLFRRLASLVGDVISLYSQRLQLNALLFHGHLYTGKAITEDARGLWTLADTDHCANWLKPLVERVAGPLAGAPEVRWVQSGTPDVLMGIVCTGGELPPAYLVKLYGKNRSAMARHEASLFSVMGSAAAPLPRLLLVEQIESFNCHMFEWLMLEPVKPQAVKRAAMTVTASLFTVRPAPALVALFIRSRPMLWQRLDRKVLERLALFAREDEVSQLEKLGYSMASIKATLEEMPVAIVTPDLSSDALWQDHQGSLWSALWGRWTLEPVGAGWLVGEKLLPLLPAAFEQAQRVRPDLKAITIKHAEFAALSFAFDKACQRQAYRTAIELVGPLLRAYNDIDGQASKGA
ncbi:hypothetical protein EGJ43_04530 [Stutzerimonas stutzeri]|uniref:hypothetical protein n=1 Tax=Stutzerimonas stutzeri TaxID=316 RepID=UPI000F745231|nr:hypothetical protein [Stutzerimonas stutzeri]RRW20046.1 hypothetical protein EGJ43_04530 [Stutzerimonas stutzeri]